MRNKVLVTVICVLCLAGWSNAEEISIPITDNITSTSGWEFADILYTSDTLINDYTAVNPGSQNNPRQFASKSNSIASIVFADCGYRDNSFQIFDGDTGTSQTNFAISDEVSHATLVPEPTTVLILGIGGLVLIRGKK